MDILVDLDNTINLLSKKWLLKCNQLFGDNFDLNGTENEILNRISQYDTSKISKGKERVFKIIEDPQFFTNIDLMLNADIVLERLSWDHNIYIVTSTPPHVMTEKLHWLKIYFPFLNLHDNVVITWQKQLVRGDVLFDDAVHNLIPWQKRNLGGFGIAMDAGYNKEWNGLRVKNWLEFKEVINNLTKYKKSFLF